jgi:hypothetical protein
VFGEARLINATGVVEMVGSKATPIVETCTALRRGPGELK